MPTSNPKPPAGYQIVQKSNPSSSVSGSGNDAFIAPDYSDVPAFIKSGIDLSKVRQVPTPVYGQDPGAIASVSSDKPYKIDVDMPDLYGPPVLNHELTHTFQFTRNPSLPSPIIPQGEDTPNVKNYVYGGVNGLQRALREGKTIADFNVEQQADMVRDYKVMYGNLLAKAQQGKATPRDLHEMYRMRQAYHPLIQQLADMPGKGQAIKMPTGAPAPPGLPDYSVAGLGVVPADPLMGGRSVYLTQHANPIKNIVTQSFQGKPVPGMVLQGNLDITKRPNIDNGDGTHSSTFSMSFGTDKGEVFVPGVGDGKNYPLRKLTPKEALDQYKKTGNNFGTFKTPAQANAYAQTLHQDQAKYGNNARKIGEQKVFSNGKTGVWDGHGWVAK